MVIIFEQLKDSEPLFIKPEYQGGKTSYRKNTDVTDLNQGNPTKPQKDTTN
jgi:hypothetical protein